MSEINTEIKGLNAEEVIASREKYGNNKLAYKSENSILEALKGLASEPMILLLLITAAIYFAGGHIPDGIFMTAAIVLIAAISLYQDSRSRNALEQLKNFTLPEAKVIRDGKVQLVKSDDLVIGDSLVAEEGTNIAADAVIVSAHDFSVNESILTGESMPVARSHNSEDNHIYKGTAVTGGLAIATITAIGNGTKLGLIGKSLEEIKEEKTPLELKINDFVKKMVIVGAVVFIVVWGINYLNTGSIADSLLKALTLAMSILPEEIPVAFTTFMALGAWRLMKMGIVVKQMKTVETLGSATIICVDKTGTITENKMTLAGLYVAATSVISEPGNTMSEPEKELVTIAMWASEPIPFDPMEIALHDAYARIVTTDERPGYSMLHEYPLGGKPPMMTHVFENNSGERIIAAKGAPEAILSLVDMSVEEREKTDAAIAGMAAKGLRLLAVAASGFGRTDFPDTQQELPFIFKGLVAFYDPPKANIAHVLQQFYTAGIGVRIITGDNALTTNAIAAQIGFRGYERTVTGEELMKLDEGELRERVLSTNIFTRMFPEAKLKIINILKENGDIVAMTGDGINDGPALKAAHIGIAMGEKGTEIAKDAASLILVDDDLSKMADAVAMGRKIYNNLKKAIQYIISIHIPIILTVFVPLVLGWIYPNIFTPVHIIFLELVMGPTCSVIYENEPMEPNAMLRAPRPFTDTFFNARELTTSILQGLMITLGALTAYRLAVYNGQDEDVTRTMVFVVLIAANIFLTLVNRSFYYSILTTIRYRNNLVPAIIVATLALSAVLIYMPGPARFFRFQPLSSFQLVICIAIGSVSVLWYELVKAWKRSRSGAAIPH